MDTARPPIFLPIPSGYDARVTSLPERILYAPPPVDCRVQVVFPPQVVSTASASTIAAPVADKAGTRGGEFLGGNPDIIIIFREALSLTNGDLPEWCKGAPDTFKSLSELEGSRIRLAYGVLVCKKCTAKHILCSPIQLACVEMIDYMCTESPFLQRMMPESFVDPLSPTCHHCKLGMLKLEDDDMKDFKRVNWLFLYSSRLLGLVPYNLLTKYCTAKKMKTPFRQSKKRSALYWVYHDISKQLFGDFGV